MGWKANYLHVAVSSGSVNFTHVACPFLGETMLIASSIYHPKKVLRTCIVLAGIGSFHPH